MMPVRTPYGTFFQVTVVDPKLRSEDFETAEEAITLVESVGSGSVVRFRNEPNGHGGFDARCSAMWSLEPEHGWWAHYIWDGRGGRISQEKPH